MDGLEYSCWMKPEARIMSETFVSHPLLQIQKQEKFTILMNIIT
jgi:hypothetical protein